MRPIMERADRASGMMLRYWPVGGSAAFAILLLFGINASFGKPDDLSAGPALVAYYADDGNAVEIAVECVSVAAAAVLLLGVQNWIGAKLLASGASTTWVSLAGRAATVATALMLTAPALWSVALWNNLFYDELSGEVTKVLLMLGWLLFAFSGMLAAALMVAATSFALKGVSGIPGWLVVLGFVAASVLVLSPMVAPIVALPIWMLVTARSLTAPA